MPDERRTGPRSTPPAFARAETGRDDETWRALPQWRSVPALRLGSDSDETGGHLLGQRADHSSRERLVVVVAHPDDETLACGGLLARAAEHDLPTVVVVATDGEASHPDSPTIDPETLAGLRREELIEAVAILHPAARLIRLGLPDGKLCGHEDTITDRLRDVVDADTLLVSTWRHDAHGDHEAVAQAAADVAIETGARHLEAPIWLWFWGEPVDVPWDRCAVLPLTPGEVEAKRQALACYPSQTAPLSDAPGDEAVLDDTLLASFRRPYETYVETRVRPPYVPRARSRDSTPDAAHVFEELHRSDVDPWRTGTSWYEARRRALALACLPRERVGTVLEVGCSVGELTAALAERADHVVAVDVSEAALAAAARRCAGRSVRLERLRVPGEWPEGSFDVVVLSEIGYFLTGAELAETLWKACSALTPDGALLLVHWRHEVEGWPLDGSDVHGAAGRVAAEHGLTLATRVVDDDVLVDLYRSKRRQSLAEEERTGPVVTPGGPRRRRLRPPGAAG